MLHLHVSNPVTLSFRKGSFTFSVRDHFPPSSEGERHFQCSRPFPPFFRRVAALSVYAAISTLFPKGSCISVLATNQPFFPKGGTLSVCMHFHASSPLSIEGELPFFQRETNPDPNRYPAFRVLVCLPRKLTLSI